MIRWPEAHLRVRGERSAESASEQVCVAVRRLVPMGSAGGLDESGASGRENRTDSRNVQKVECVEQMGGGGGDKSPAM